MIQLKFSNTKGRALSHKVMQSVAEDVQLFNKITNAKFGLDLPLPCPVGVTDDPVGIANSSELWFGEKRKGFDFVNINVMKDTNLTLYSNVPKTKLLYQLTTLSLCEQFIYTKFSTTEDFSEAIKIYEDNLGSISKNACESLDLSVRK